MESQVVHSEGVSKFKSPARMLIRFFRSSRDKWKHKYMEIKRDVKRFKNQAHDARRSRADWKEKALALEAQVQQLQSELEHRAQDTGKTPRLR